MRVLLLPQLCLCTALSACNVAMSDRPLFADAQRSSTLILEDGLWLMVDADCDVDTAKAKDIWPKCSNWVILRNSKMISGPGSKPDD